MDRQNRDRVPTAAREVIELFEQRAEELRFPDVDVDVLERLADSVAKAAIEVAKAEAVLTAAREEQRRREDALLLQAKRGLAYARVFAESDPDLMESLHALSLSQTSADKPARPTRRKRSTAKHLDGSSEAEALPFPAQA